MLSFGVQAGDGVMRHWLLCHVFLFPRRFALVWFGRFPGGWYSHILKGAQGGGFPRFRACAVRLGLWTPISRGLLISYITDKGLCRE